MLYSFLKHKARKLMALLVKPVLLSGSILLFTLINSKVANAAHPIQGTLSLLASPTAIQCYPVPTQGGNPLDGTPPLSVNPVDWIGWVLGQLCKAVATVFFSLTNQVINWGSGCSQAGLNFVTQTPNYIRLDAGKADNWQLFFWDGRFIGAALLLQFSWTALTIMWNRQNGNGYAGAQEALTRTLLGGILLIISAGLLEWAVSFCNLLNSLFADRLSLFDPNSFQVDANGNIFNTILSMAAALASLLLVMQMATRYIYLILLQFIFPIGSILWVNRSTQGYARLLFTSFIATLFVQPLQLAVIYITSNLKDGTRDDTSLSMLFGICGLFLTLGLPRVMGSVLGGGTPVGAWGIFAISRIAAGGVASTVRNANRAGGGNNGGGGGNTSFGRRNPSPSGGSGGGRSGQGNNSRPPTALNPSVGQGSASPSSASAGTEAASAPDENLRHGGIGQRILRSSGTNSQVKEEQPDKIEANPAQGASKTVLPSKAIPITGERQPGNEKANSKFNEPAVGEKSKPNLTSTTAPQTPAKTPTTQILGEGASSKNSNSLPVVKTSAGDNSSTLPQNSVNKAPEISGEPGPTTIYRNRNGLVPRGSFGKNNTNPASSTRTAGPGVNTPSNSHSNISASATSLVGTKSESQIVIQPSLAPTFSRSRPSGYRPKARHPQTIQKEQKNGGENEL